MFVLKTLPVYLLLLLVDVAPASADGFVSRSIKRAHSAAAKRTHALARDLRVAFGGILVSQDNTATPKTRVVYCKSGSQGVLGGGSSGNNTGTSPSTGSDSSSSTSGSSTSGHSTSSHSAGSSGTSTKTATSSRGSATSSPVSTPWQLVESHSGNDFFDGWGFYTASDPTNGIVNYVNEATARSNNLLEVNSDGNAIMRVETTGTVATNRMSVRITTKSTFDGMLIIMDSIHMPSGCGTWPAFWTNGPNWPAGGEIDIIEGVGDYTNNQATIHTDPGCTISSSTQSKISGNVIGGTNCAAAQTGNQGCGIRATSSVSYGAGFNNNGGGVYAMQWDDDGIAIYFFERDDIPSDITAGTPLPSSWGKPMALWPASSCDPFKFFNTHSAIFDTTLCGDWAGGVWSSSGIPGQEQSCAARTGVSTCEAYVRANGAAMQEAYWEVKSVKIYQTK